MHNGVHHVSNQNKEIDKPVIILVADNIAQFFGVWNKIPVQQLSRLRTQNQDASGVFEIHHTYSPCTYLPYTFKSFLYNGYPKFMFIGACLVEISTCSHVPEKLQILRK